MIFHGLGEIPAGFGPSVVTIGNFDGVHIGHRQLLRRAAAAAKERNAAALMLTFHPHPARIVAPERTPRLLSTPEERAVLARAEGVDHALVLPFDARLAATSPEEFARDVLARRLGARLVIVGDNFRFGAHQAGDVRRLAELGAIHGFDTEVVGAVCRRGIVVSSTRVRRLIEAGSVARAARFLERPYALEGEVVAGRGIGSKQTAPTLNLATGAEVMPAHGVYITLTTDIDNGRRWRSVTNLGVRPTFGGGAVSVETFLLDPFDGETPARIRVEFLRMLRGEKKFESVEALKAQIYRDAARAKAFFRRLERLRSAASHSRR